MRKNLVSIYVEISNFLILTGLMVAAFSAGQFTLAQQLKDRGLLGNYQNGHQAGLASRAADYREGYSKYAYCPGGTADYYAELRCEWL